MLYLVVKCNEINSWECDITKDPLYIRDEKNIPSTCLNKGYELYIIFFFLNLMIKKLPEKT